MKKKSKIILCIIIILLLVISIFAFIFNSKNNLIEINYNEFNDKINNKENFVLMISQTTCHHCMDFKPILNRIAKENNIIIFYIEYDLLNLEEKENFDNIINFNATPTTVFIKDGEEKSMANRIDGIKNDTYIINKLKSNGFIK